MKSALVKLSLLLTLGVALAACGKVGPLEPPPAQEEEKKEEPLG